MHGHATVFGQVLSDSSVEVIVNMLCTDLANIRELGIGCVASFAPFPCEGRAENAINTTSGKQI